jgi:hypothetical protein
MIPVLDEIRRAGGLARWQPPLDLKQEDWQRGIWVWLKSHLQQRERRPLLLLGYGTDDRFAGACEMLADHLPAGQVYRAPGGHDWPPWLAIFERFLARGSTFLSK